MSKIGFACSDTPEGNWAIAAINDVLIRHRHAEEFKKTLALVAPPGREKLYWREYEKILKIVE
ncbi:MAG: hypothetical protein OQK24_06460 [Magnetovibrio sp.]|nr:hypothetical protein [Magnetovibrio sp.]